MEKAVCNLTVCPRPEAVVDGVFGRANAAASGRMSSRPTRSTGR
jgi:hypothetical protein